MYYIGYTVDRDASWRVGAVLMYVRLKTDRPYRCCVGLCDLGAKPVETMDDRGVRSYLLPPVYRV